MDKKKALAILLLLEESEEERPSRSCWVRQELESRSMHGEFAIQFQIQLVHVIYAIDNGYWQISHNSRDISAS